MRHDPRRTAAFFDAYREREWTRFEDGRTGSISLAVHQHYVRRYVRPGMRVLDAGAGPGRFTLLLAEIGARVVVADVSPEQLRLNRDALQRAGLGGFVDAWLEADIVDLGQFADDEFDAVVCYGGPLSYVLDRRAEAARELVRVLRPHGQLLVSVMSLIGSAAFGFPQVVADMRRFGREAIDAAIRTGDLPSDLSGGHLEMHMFRPAELRELLERAGADVVMLSASSFVTGRLHEALVATLTPEERKAVTRWVIELGAERGAEALGEHLIAVARKPGG